MTVKIPSEIRRIQLNNASFKNTDMVIDNLTFVNFFFGNNGSGKSTIAKAIKNGMGVTYAPDKSNDDYLTLVYNEEFIDKNFHSYRNMKGVFTINETNQNILEQMEIKSSEAKNIEKVIEDLEKELKYQKKRRKDLEADFYNICWIRSTDIRSKLAYIQEGKNDPKLFAEAVIAAEPVRQDPVNLKSMWYASMQQDSVYYKTFTRIPDAKVLDNIEGKDLFPLAVINFSDTAYARFINNIKATDWVRAGHEMFAHAAGWQCPYCSQQLPVDFEAVIKESFSEDYRDAINTLNDFLKAYENNATELLDFLAVPDPLMPGLDVTEYLRRLDELKTSIQLNIEKISSKIDSPINAVHLVETAPILKSLNKYIEEANAKINMHNMFVENRKETQEKNTEIIFSHIGYTLKEEIVEYNKRLLEIDTVISDLEEILSENESQITIIEEDIRHLEESKIETYLAKERINRMLCDSGMQGIQLEMHENLPNVYKVVRPDGTIADNLSEGEKNFIAFLYYYYLVQGNEAAEEDRREKIVVIDDPVSSMDSNSLFIVSSLIRNMIEICRNNADNENAISSDNYIKQIFILTHNAFFHQEITYNYVSKYEYASFFLVQKHFGKSNVAFCDEVNPKEPTKRINVNPVKNTYAALWDEYNEVTTFIPLMSIIRKILEYYFLQLCGIEGAALQKEILIDNKDRFVDAEGNFNQEQYHLASAMLSYISSVSLGLNDGMFYVDEHKDVSECRKIFCMIFKIMGQEQHYLRMCKPYEKKKLSINERRNRK